MATKMFGKTLFISNVKLRNSEQNQKVQKVTFSEQKFESGEFS